jgi:hypothetical protein
MTCLGMSEKNKYCNEDDLKTENNLLNEFNELLDIDSSLAI